MPLANVRGAIINYEVIGTQGTWIALAPGGRLGPNEEWIAKEAELAGLFAGFLRRVQENGAAGQICSATQ